MFSQKKDDCFICAYAEAENISWKVSKRRLRKFRRNKSLGCFTGLLRKFGLKKWEIVNDGSFESIQKILNYGDGIFLIQWQGENEGHAVYYNGRKFVDNNPLTKDYDYRRIILDNILHTVLRRKNVPKLTKLKNMAYEKIYNFFFYR